MSAINPTPSPYRNWKVKQYTVSLETRLAQERAHRHQPPMMSLHQNTEKRVQEEQVLCGQA